MAEAAPPRRCGSASSPRSSTSSWRFSRSAIWSLRQPATSTARADSTLDGWPALLLLVLIGVYFYVGRRVVGGTLWDRFFGIGRPQPK